MLNRAIMLGIAYRGKIYAGFFNHAVASSLHRKRSQIHDNAAGLRHDGSVDDKAVHYRNRRLTDIDAHAIRILIGPEPSVSEGNGRKKGYASATYGSIIPTNVPA